ncbi:MAG TPA: BamA/TamA family outer membrane protein [Pontibacter sp.]
MKRLKPRFYIFGLLITILFSAGCVPTKNLGQDEKLLLGIKPVGLKRIEKASIENLYQQKPNRTFLGSTPYLWVYNVGKNFYNPPKIDARIQKQISKWREKVQAAGNDTVRVRKLRKKYSDRVDRLRDKKEKGNFLMQLGEPPAIYDSTLMQKTLDQVSIFMNASGYFNHTVTLQKKEKGKLVYATLLIDENEPYRYAQLNYSIPDTAVLSLVKANAGRSLLKLQDIFNEEVLTLERDRLYDLLRNNGYYDFARAYIEFEIDTLDAEVNATAVSTIIRNPETGGKHQVYTINNVYFKTDVDRFGIPRDTITYNNINYVAYKQKYAPKVLDKKVDIYPGANYSMLRTSTTQRKIADLDVFQFNNVLYSKTADSTNRLNAFINAIPSKRFQETTELGFNFTERKPGPFASIRLRMRNVFGGAENLDLGIRGGFEGQISLTKESETVMIKEFGGDLSLTFPTILAPYGRGLLTKYSPRTRIYTGYTSVDRQEYKRSNYQLSLDYIWQKSRTPLQAPTLQYTFSPLNLNIVQVDTISQAFKENLERYSQGSRSLIESFNSAFISSMSFNVIYNTNDFTQSRNARYFRGNVEVGGLSQELGLNVTLNNLRTYQFARFNPDYRRYIPLGNKRFFVYRINTGIAVPIFKSEVLPYDKYFFAGGPSSVRAWQSRRLGPGSFVQTREVEKDGEVVMVPDFEAEQPGGVLIETSAEYRFNILSFLNGALFVDAGNVWTLEQDSARPGASFRFDSFYKEMAVGTGFGLRFDLTVLVLRFDFATKVYAPGGINGKKFVLGDFRFSEFFSGSNQSNLNIGIGYPF